VARIRGSYPGGPRREDASAGPTDRSGARLERVEDIETRMGRSSKARERRRRARRVWSGFVVAIALAGGVGLYLGFTAHRSSEQLTDARQGSARAQRDSEIARETNRVLMELWRMEDVEKQPTPP
jgi:hypothetical protein